MTTITKENGEFCTAVAPATWTAGILTRLSVVKTGSAKTKTSSVKTKTKTKTISGKTKTKTEVFETKTKTANGSMKQNAHSSHKNYFYQKLQRH